MANINSDIVVYLFTYIGNQRKILKKRKFNKPSIDIFTCCTLVVDLYFFLNLRIL